MKSMNRKKSRTAPPTLPELDQTKTSVLNSLTSLQSRRSYQHAMNEFIEWYCSEPRLALNRAVVLRYRLQLEAKKLAASTINVRLAAVRRMAYEAADTGLLSPELVAGIRRVKGVPQLGRREIGSALQRANGSSLEPPPIRFGRSVTPRLSRYSLAVDFGDRRSLPSPTAIFTSGKTTGPSLTWSAKPGMCGPFPYQVG